MNIDNPLRKKMKNFAHSIVVMNLNMELKEVPFDDIDDCSMNCDVVDR